MRYIINWKERYFENHRTIDLTILTAINDTRKEFRIELDKLESNYTELREKIVTATVITSILVQHGFNSHTSCRIYNRYDVS